MPRLKVEQRAQTYDTYDTHLPRPVPVDLVLTGETVAYLCDVCLEPCTRVGDHIAPSIGLERRWV